MTLCNLCNMLSFIGALVQIRLDPWWLKKDSTDSTNDVMTWVVEKQSPLSRYFNHIRRKLSLSKLSPFAVGGSASTSYYFLCKIACWVKQTLLFCGGLHKRCFVYFEYHLKEIIQKLVQMFSRYTIQMKCRPLARSAAHFIEEPPCVPWEIRGFAVCQFPWSKRNRGTNFASQSRVQLAEGSIWPLWRHTKSRLNALHLMPMAMG